MYGVIGIGSASANIGSNCVWQRQVRSAYVIEVFFRVVHVRYFFGKHFHVLFFNQEIEFLIKDFNVFLMKVFLS